MSQLMQVVRPGRNAVRQAKKAKEIRKVKAAIVWHERERKKRQAFKQERWEAVTNFRSETFAFEKKAKRRLDKALDEMREDWKLGPLRPNRAIGEDAEKYGALTAEQIQRPQIPLHKQRYKNEDRQKRGLEPEYPLVVDDKLFYPYARGDRVVVIRGREKGKIGIVQSYQDETHRVIVKGVNMQYYDSSLYLNMGQDPGPKRESEVPLPLDDLRLVIPYEITRDGRKIFTDVIVDKIHMERHTRGVDPFTRWDYGDAEFPPEHRFDPSTGLPIWNRYIAGTRQRIQWPEDAELDFEDEGVTDEDTTDNQGWAQKTKRYLRHPIQSFKDAREEPARAKAAKEAKEAKHILEQQRLEARVEEIAREEEERLTYKPEGQPFHRSEAHDLTDTTRNIVDRDEPVGYTLIAPPFPETLQEELRNDIQSLAIKSNRDKDAVKPLDEESKRSTGWSKEQSDIDEAKRLAAERMKTPMQLRWEQEHAKKVQERETSPLVTTHALMAALGKHMKSARVNAGKARRHYAKAQELD